MTDAEEAYAAAETAIIRAIREGTEELHFNHSRFQKLESLPKEIGDIPNLSLIDLQNTSLTDAALRRLQGLPRLDTIYLDRTEISDDGIRFLARQANLETVSIENCSVTDKGAIDLCKLSRLRNLSLAWTLISDLTIAGLAEAVDLEVLSLSETAITDQSVISISKWTGLRALWINDTNILDLRPLRSNLLLVERPDYSGLQFRNTAATRADPRIAKIAEIEDNAERARTLFDYLKDWEPPRSTPPDDAPLAPSYVFPDDGPVQSQDITPVGGDEDQQFLQDDLRRKIRQLIETIGGSNELADLRTSAEHYETQIARDLAEIRLKLLYSAANTLRVAYEADTLAEETGRINDQLPPKIGATLKDLVETHGLFYSGFPNAADIHQQMKSGLTGQRDAEQLQLAERIVDALRDRPNALTHEDQAAMADDLAAAKGQGPSAEIGEKSLHARLWNMFGAIGRRVYAGGKWSTATVAAHDMIQFMLGQKTLIEGWIIAAQGSGIGQWIVSFFRALGAG